MDTRHFDVHANPSLDLPMSYLEPNCATSSLCIMLWCIDLQSSGLSGGLFFILQHLQLTMKEMLRCYNPVCTNQAPNNLVGWSSVFCTCFRLCRKYFGVTHCRSPNYPVRSSTFSPFVRNTPVSLYLIHWTIRWGYQSLDIMLWWVQTPLHRTFWKGKSS